MVNKLYFSKAVDENFLKSLRANTIGRQNSQGAKSEGKGEGTATQKAKEGGTATQKAPT